MSDWLSRRSLSIAIILIVAALAHFAVLDKIADRCGMSWATAECSTYLHTWTDQATATAGTAALMNAGLSVIEDSEFDITPLGVGVSLAVGDAVRPVNDVVSKILSVALVGAVSLWIQQTLITLGVQVGFKWFLTISLVFTALAVLWDSRLVRRLAWGFFVLAVVARFLIPGAVLLTGKVGDQFTKTAYTQAQAKFEQLASEATKTKDLVIDAIPNPKDIAVAINPFSAKVEQPSFKEVRDQVSHLLADIAAMADDINNLVVTYLIVFVVQTILMPVLILWALIKLPRYLLDPAAMTDFEEWFFTLLRGDGEPGGGTPRNPEPVGDAGS